ncbi:hypothetical protein KOR42_11630 [Thalassoglobus neptunius]|uniref:Uncharacterized protein n=1 Tax=Thalassoglobus neptunius TaxID=1938619 RepID=A0A5C5X480_9PLAN|nr:sulfotransferase [Thalassoglobus neptunius]TWT57796.1 hypothetical protein KOR42_11630 [Thalassoglobus neptunius]
MREFNKIHVIALPRCATVSMAEGLGALGVSVAHLGKIFGEQSPHHHDAKRLIRMHEQIARKDYDLDILSECDGLADYPVCIPEIFEALDQQFPESLFINVRRDENLQSWIQSAEKQFIGLRLLKTGDGATEEDRQFAEAMADFRRMTFGQSEFDPDVFLKAYHQHQDRVRNYFSGREDQLLDIPDVSLLRENGFQLLCGFLKCDTKQILFPQKNDHSVAPQQAFFDALKEGKIDSKTGLRPS